MKKEEINSSYDYYLTVFISKVNRIRGHLALNDDTFTCPACKWTIAIFHYRNATTTARIFKKHLEDCEAYQKYLTEGNEPYLKHNNYL
ncbi:MAG: hypothetical protein ACFFBD_29360 [Candidatus Hodarchaeota archaeon]